MEILSPDEMQLGSILVREGFVHDEQVQEAIELQKIRDKRIGDLLLELGYIDEGNLLQALSSQFDIPYRTDISESIDPVLTTKVPLGFIRQYEMVPFAEEDGVFQIAIRNPINLLPLEDLRLLLNGPVRPVLCSEKDLRIIIDGYFDQQSETATEMIETITSNGDEQVFSLDEEMDERDLLDLANEAPIIKLINLMISGAIKERASDIHVEPFEREVIVRYRIDGLLYQKFNVPKHQNPAVVSRIKIMANLNIAEQRLPQDGRIKILLSGKEVDIRVSIIPVQHGERVVMRILEKGNFLLGLEELGMASRDYGHMDKLIRNSHGIVLVTGPTGSGKSTTLYASLQRVLSPDINVITVEDPVEYQMPGVGQIEVRPKIGLTFASALRSILRQDPDVVLVGEIRDEETAEMAVHASLTGHLVFSTLHTNDSAGAITRLINMGIEPFLVTSSTIAVIAQRLVRRLCPKCKRSYVPEVAALSELGPHALEYSGKEAFLPVGCSACLDRGYMGRSGIFELMAMTPQIQELTLTGADSNAIKREARKGGMFSLRDDGTRRAFLGETSIEEVLRVTRDDSTDEIPE
jgi:general secretion pathway protein E